MFARDIDSEIDVRLDQISGIPGGPVFADARDDVMPHFSQLALPLQQLKTTGGRGGIAPGMPTGEHFKTVERPGIQIPLRLKIDRQGIAEHRIGRWRLQRAG